MLQQAKVATFEQVNVMASRVGRNAAATQGACHCFSLHWLSMILGNPGGAAKDRAAVLGKGAGGSKLILQKVFGTRWGTDGHDNSDYLAAREFRLTFDDLLPMKAFGFSEIQWALSLIPGKGAIYSFWFNGSIPGAAGGAHSIAFYSTTMGGQAVFHVFDPNFGEFVCTKPEFRQLMGELFGLYGPVTKHWMRSATRS